MSAGCKIDDDAPIYHQHNHKDKMCLKCPYLDNFHTFEAALNAADERSRCINRVKSKQI